MSLLTSTTLPEPLLMTPAIAITMGDPAGIGPEIIAMAFRDAPEVMAHCFVAGDVQTLRRALQFIGREGQIALPVARIESPQALPRVPPRCLPVLQISEHKALAPVGRVSALAGKMAGDCVLWAARAALAGEITAMVTGPLHKEALAAAGAPFSGFPGHTELLQAEAAAFLGLNVAELPVRMMLANDELRTVLVSIHLSLRDAIEAVSFENVLQTLRITDAALRVSRDVRRALLWRGSIRMPARVGCSGMKSKPSSDRRSRPLLPADWTCMGLLRLTQCSCGRAPAGRNPANSTWWLRCTTTRA
jgi:4-hydroxy-L-threonine phosphate dehydrogenase PdxA